MSKKQKFMRLMISGTLLAAVALVGVSVYQVDMSQQKNSNPPDEIQNEEAENIQDPITDENLTADWENQEPHYAVIEDEDEEIPEDTAEENLSEHVSSGDVTAQLENQENLDEDAAAAAGSGIVPDVSFTGEVLMNWPVEGTVLMDYSMDRSIYFETLDVYKYNPSVILSAEVGTPVEAAANMKILDVTETLETGTTVTADLGNGYQAVYGQLKDVLVSVNDVVTAGTVLGYVNEPTKYYAKEGANLYFSMTKDGTSIDPVLYLP